jgi:hypothetical protein
MSRTVTLDFDVWARLAYLHHTTNQLTAGGLPFIWLCSNGANLTAIAEGEGFHFAVRLEATPPGVWLQLAVPPGLLSFVSSLAPQECDLTVHFDPVGNAQLEWSDVQATFGAPTTQKRPSSSRVADIDPLFELSAKEFQFAAHILGTPPVSVSASQARQIPSRIEYTPHHEVTLTRDWRPFEHEPSITRITATPLNEISTPASAVTDHLPLVAYAIAALSSSEEDIRVSLPDSRSPLLRLGTDRWSITVATVPCAATSVVNILQEVLIGQELSCERVADNSLVVGSYPDLVRVDACGDMTARLRCSLVLASNITPSLELYEEINQINIGLEDISIWLHEGRIVLGIDTHDTAPDHVIRCIEAIRHRAEQLTAPLLAFAYSPSTN